MKHRTQLLAIAVLAVSFAGCGSGNYDQAEKALNDVVASQEKIVAALNSINSPDDVDAAVAQIDAVGVEVRDTLMPLKTLQLTKSEGEKLQKSMLSKKAELESSMMSAVEKAQENAGDRFGEIESAVLRYEAGVNALRGG